MSHPKIQVKNLEHTYYDTKRNEKVIAIQNLTLDVQEGELMSILGPSGCGKSTLLYIIAGLTRSDRQAIFIDGSPVKGPGPDRGMVFQEYALLPWKTVYKNIELGLQIQKVPAKSRQAQIQQIIDLVGLEGFEHKFPHELSGGMKQRVAVARTLVTRPKVMLMDEPFAAVDAQTRITMQEEVVRIWEKTRQTILFVTHSVEEAAFLADRVAILTHRPGRVKEIVTVDMDRSRRRDVHDDRYTEIREHLLRSVRAEVQTRKEAIA